MKNKSHSKFVITVSSLLMSLWGNQAKGESIHSGLYVGTGVGLTNLSGTLNFDTLDMTAIGVLLRDQRASGLSTHSAAGSVFIGYGHKRNGLWLAGELSYLLDTLNDERSVRFMTLTQDKTLQIQSTGGSIGLAAHIGYTHQNWLAYIILGAEQRRFKMNFEDSVSDATVVNKKYSSLAFTPGIGILVKVTKNMGFRCEYKYAFHSPKTASASSVILGNNNTTTFKIRPRVQTFQIGLVYNF